MNIPESRYPRADHFQFDDNLPILPVSEQLCKVVGGYPDNHATGTESLQFVFRLRYARQGSLFQRPFRTAEISSPDPIPDQFKISSRFLGAFEIFLQSAKVSDKVFLLHCTLTGFLEQPHRLFKIPLINLQFCLIKDFLRCMELTILVSELAGRFCDFVTNCIDYHVLTFSVGSGRR